MLGIVVAIALAIALAPYILSIFGWIGVVALACAGVRCVFFGLDRFGDWFETTRIGRFVTGRKQN